MQWIVSKAYLLFFHARSQINKEGKHFNIHYRIVDVPAQNHVELCLSKTVDGREEERYNFIVKIMEIGKESI
ncbi:hypothetical protein B1690_06875 [Geobacillus sp. 46C-IIa]|nr:hypothetical protein B1690_06875 [Geobacillus sp. 46C-IIa]